MKKEASYTDLSLSDDNKPNLFHSLYDYEKSNNEFAFAGRYLQIDRGRSVFEQDCIYLPDLILRRVWFSHTLMQEVVIRDGWITFIFTPASLTKTASWDGISVSTNMLAIFHSKREHTALTPSRWFSIEIDIAEPLIGKEDLFLENIIANAINPQKGLFRLPAPIAVKIRHNLGILLDHYALQSNTALSAEALRSLRRQILDQLALAADFVHEHLSARSGLSYHQSYQLVLKAQSLLDEQLRNNPTIDSLACQLNVTVRTLQRSFKKVLGISPKQYILACRLDMARREIYRRGSRGTIIDVAYEFNFASLSRFIEQFDRHFGYSPSIIKRSILT